MPQGCFKKVVSDIYQKYCVLLFQMEDAYNHVLCMNTNNPVTEACRKI